MKYVSSESIQYEVNLSSEVSAMFNSLTPSLNSRSLPFVVVLGGFPSRFQNLSSGVIRLGGRLFLHIWQCQYGTLIVCMYHDILHDKILQNDNHINLNAKVETRKKSQITYIAYHISPGNTIFSKFTIFGYLIY